MKIENSDHIIKHIPKEMFLRNETFNNLEICINYKESEKSYYINFTPVYVEGPSTTLIPILCKEHRLLGVNRRSKNNIKKAIEIYNNDIENFTELLLKAYKTEFTKEELKIEIN